MKKIIFLSISIFLITHLIHAQSPKFQWIKGGGSIGTSWNNEANESAKWLGTDARGNIYGMSSLFSPSCQIDTFNLSNGYGYDDFGVFSYHCNGSLRWVRYYGSSSQDYTGGYSVDQQGNSYVSGYVSINNLFLVNGHFGDTTIISTPNMNCGNFIAKLDSNGHTSWLKLLGNTQNDLWIKIIQQEFDNQGNPCLLIDFLQTGLWANYNIPQKGFYVVRINKNTGNTIDVTKLDFYINNRLIFFNVDETNNFYINLQVTDTVFLGANIILNTYSIDHYSNYILAKFSSAGNLIWYKELGGKPGADLTERLMLGKPIIKNNKIYINGAANNHISVFGDTINNPYLTIPYQRIPMNLCFDKSTGNFLNLRHLYNTNYCDYYFTSIVTDKIYMANSARGLVRLNNTDSIPYVNNNKAYPFIIAMDTNYTQIDWGIATKVTGDDTRIEALTVDNAGNLYAGGRVTDSIYNSYGSAYKSLGGESDFFIAKIAYSNNCGCVLAQPNPLLVSLNGNFLTVKGNATGTLDSLYWFWGDGSKTKYMNQNTNATHSYSTPGNYTVNLRTYNYCGIKDGGFPINVLGIKEQELNYINAYPNPVTNILTIENPYQCSMQLRIYSIAGKLLYSNKFENYTSTIDMSSLEAGIYFIDMQLADGRRTVKKVVTQ